MNDLPLEEPRAQAQFINDLRRLMGRSVMPWAQSPELTDPRAGNAGHIGWVTDRAEAAIGTLEWGSPTVVQRVVANMSWALTLTGLVRQPAARWREQDAGTESRPRGLL